MAKLVVLDPGHGGSDPGAVGNGLKEKEVALAICKRMRTALRRDYKVEVALTRENNETDVSLDGRADFANRKHATAFVSVHINSAANPSARGFETFRHTGSSDTSRAAILQSAVHESVMEAMRPQGIIDRKEKSANFAVLRSTTCRRS